MPQISKMESRKNEDTYKFSVIKEKSRNKHFYVLREKDLKILKNDKLAI